MRGTGFVNVLHHIEDKLSQRVRAVVGVLDGLRAGQCPGLGVEGGGDFIRRGVLPIFVAGAAIQISRAIFIGLFKVEGHIKLLGKNQVSQNQAGGQKECFFHKNLAIKILSSHFKKLRK